MLILCGSTWMILEWKRQTRDFSDAALMARLPGPDGTLAFLNVQALRESGLLEMIAGSRTTEDPEYKAFVSQTGFDYRDNLDAVFASFLSDANLFLLRGRFSWEQISEYIRSNQGGCLNGVCWMEVKKGRYLSVLPLAPDVLALGTGDNKGVAYEALTVHERPAWKPSSEPFWVKLSAEQLSDPRKLPEGTRAFATAMRGARSVVLGVAPGGSALEARLRAEFATSDEAAARRGELEQATSLLQKFFARDRQTPSPADLSGMLTSGRFEQDKSEVRGVWPLDRALLERVVGGM